MEMGDFCVSELKSHTPVSMDDRVDAPQAEGGRFELFNGAEFRAVKDRAPAQEHGVKDVRYERDTGEPVEVFND
jgi:hypothetical protein